MKQLKHALRVIRARVLDVAFAFRMGAGFPGDVNRTHPVSVEPSLQSATSPCTAYGQALVVDGVTNTLRRLLVGDAAVTKPYGIAVRPYPTQDGGAANAFGATTLGAATPPAAGEIDVMRSGYIMVQMNSLAGAVNKGGAVFVWVAATVAGHVQGQYESAANGGNTAALDANLYQFNGPADSAGVVEISVNP